MPTNLDEKITEKFNNILPTNLDDKLTEKLNKLNTITEKLSTILPTNLDDKIAEKINSIMPTDHYKKINHIAEKLNSWPTNLDNKLDNIAKKQARFGISVSDLLLSLQSKLHGIESRLFPGGDEETTSTSSIDEGEDEQHPLLRPMPEHHDDGDPDAHLSRPLPAGEQVLQQAPVADACQP